MLSKFPFFFLVATVPFLAASSSHKGRTEDTPNNVVAGAGGAS